MLAIACLLLLGVSAVAMTREAAARRQVIAVARDQGLERRHPAVAQTVDLLDDNGEAAQLFAEALVGELDASLHASATATAAAEGLALSGLARRPGSAHLRFLLGRSAALGESPARWARPLELAASAAPGLDLASSELARRYLESWESLTPEQRRKAEEALGRAFQSPAFLRTSFPRAVATIGPAGAVQALPDDPTALDVAAQVVGKDSLAADLIAARLKALPAAPGTSRPTS